MNKVCKGFEKYGCTKTAEGRKQWCEDCAARFEKKNSDEQERLASKAAATIERIKTGATTWVLYRSNSGAFTAIKFMNGKEIGLTEYHSLWWDKLPVFTTKQYAEAFGHDIREVYISLQSYKN